MTTATTNGATPLDPDESDGLIPTHITTLAELNEWEQANIVQAELWAFSRSRGDVLSVPYIRELHKRMFGDTWRWAGKFRTTEKTIGVPSWQITDGLANLCDDARYWIDNRVFSIDEAAARFHHRLTFIHPYPNGNGRHARLMTDVLLATRGRPRFDWGRHNLHGTGDARDRYVAALRAAEDHDFDALFEFLELSVRSGRR